MFGIYALIEVLPGEPSYAAQSSFQSAQSPCVLLVWYRCLLGSATYNAEGFPDPVIATFHPTILNPAFPKYFQPASFTKSPDWSHIPAFEACQERIHPGPGKRSPRYDRLHVSQY